MCLFEVCQKAAVKINFVVGEFQGNVQGPLTGQGFEIIMTAEFAQGQTLSVRVADFHPAHLKPDTVYALKVYTDKGLAFVLEFDGTVPVSLTLPVQKRGFYRCEVWNESDHLPVAFSNPIWLD